MKVKKENRYFNKFKKLIYEETTVILAIKYLRRVEDHYSNVEYRPFNKSDITLFSAGFPNLEQLYDSSHGKFHGLVTEVDGEPAGCIWYTDKVKEKEGLHPFYFDIQPPKNGVYVFASYILPKFRGSKAFFSQPVTMNNMMYDLGYRVSVSTYFDPRVFKYHMRHGFFKIGELKFKRYLYFFVKSDLSDLDKVCTLKF